MEPKDYMLGAGVVVTLVLGIWNAVANYRASRRTTFINTVTSERVKWIGQVRETISRLCGLTYNWSASGLHGTQEEHKVLHEIDHLRHLIRVQLNPNAEPDQEIERLIAEIPNATDPSKFNHLQELLDELIKATQQLLKAEWEKVKDESEQGRLEDEKMRRPNWQRGLLRLWVVCLGAWAIIVGCLFFPSLQEAVKSPSPGMIERSLTLARSYRDGSMPSEKQELYAEALRRGLLASITLDVTNQEMIVAFKDGVEIRVPKDADAANVEEAVNTLFIKKRNDKFLEVALWGVVPPFAVLTFSWSAFVLATWVVRGFKSVDA